MLAEDKVKHFFVNAVVVTGTTLVLLGLGFEAIPAYTASVFLAAGLSVGKEYGDSRAVGNKWDWWDIYYDAIGIIIGICSSISTLYLGKYLASLCLYSIYS